MHFEHLNYIHTEWEPAAIKRVCCEGQDRSQEKGPTLLGKPDGQFMFSSLNYFSWRTIERLRTWCDGTMCEIIVAGCI